MAITAQAIVDRVRQKLGSGGKDSPVDTFLAGNPDSEVKGIVTTFAPSLEVLSKAVAAGKNMIISRESPFWARGTNPGGTGPGGTAPGPPGFASAPPAGGARAGAPGGGGGGGRGQVSMDNDPIYRMKRDTIAAHNLIVYRLFDNWNARQPDGQLQGLARALGWEKSYKPSGGQPWGTGNGFFTIRPATLEATARSIKKTLKMKSIRIVGDPETRVAKAALSHGICWLVDLQKLVAEPGVDLVLIGEPMWENEVAAYFFDIVASGQKKGLIVLGQEVSEEPGCGEMAAWLRSFVSEVPIEWIPTGEPCWMPY
jgi:putative NIF3 family GTP cyclohydrolase 1 type 2